MMGDVIVLFNYPRELMSTSINNDLDAFVAFNTRTKKWGYASNKGWGKFRWTEEESRTFSEQQAGKTFKIDFEVVNRLNNNPNILRKVTIR